MKATLFTAAVLFCLVAPIQPAHGNGWFAEVLIGYSISPVPMNVEGKSLEERIRIYRGSYLVNSEMECVGCHHAARFLPGGSPFLGQPEAIDASTYLRGGNTFGLVVARNLTPDGSGRPAGLTFAQFAETMRTGTDFKALPPHVPADPGLLQVMPWPAYRHLTTQTLRELYAYLSAIPCLEGGPGQPANRCAP